MALAKAKEIAASAPVVVFRCASLSIDFLNRSLVMNEHR
jgi:hypothetical protein